MKHCRKSTPYLKPLLIMAAFTALVAVPFSVSRAQEDTMGKAMQQSMIWTGVAKQPKGQFAAFRKRFTLAEKPSRATLHLFADVRYLLWVNGRYVLRGPNRFEPKGPEYDTVDLTSSLQKGGNVLTVLVLGNCNNGKMVLHPPGLTASLQLVATNGQRTTMLTDGTWKWSDQTRYGIPSINWGNIIDNIDARREDGDWTLPEYNDSKWIAAAAVSGTQWGALTPRRIPPLRDTPVELKFSNHETFPVTLTAGQSLTFDTERLVQAYTVLDIDAEAGSRLELPSAVYLAKAGRQTYISTDTHGIAAGALKCVSGKVTIHGLKLVEWIYPFDRVGSFESSDPMLNRLWALCTRSLQVLSEDAYVDCGDRERVEWMDNDPPAFDVTRVAMAGPAPGGGKTYADARLLGEMLRRTAFTLQPEGWVKAHTCSDRFDIHAKMEDRACDWVEGARRYYESCGDKEIIHEIWPTIVRQMNWFLAKRTPRGLVNAREWVVWGNPTGYQTFEGAGLNAFVYKALVDAAYLGNILGEKTQAAEFGKAAEDLAAAFNNVLWDEKDGTYYSGYFADFEKVQAEPKARKLNMKVENSLVAPTMFPALFALDQGIVPPARRASVTKYLLGHREQASRVMTFYYLFKQLYGQNDAGLDKEVVNLMRTKWEKMSEWQWQTTWEELGGGSKAHCYGMFPAYFLSSYVLGVRVDGAVWDKRLLIEPRLGGLPTAAGTVVTEFGPVPVAWKQTESSLGFHCEVPAGVKTALHLPLQPGKESVTLDGAAVHGTPAGRWLSLELSPGTHDGTY